MRQFKTPLRKRLYDYRCYWKPDNRLARVNAKREARGLPLLSSVDEIGRYDQRQRDGKGRFV